jgi:hypothetical protein
VVNGLPDPLSLNKVGQYVFVCIPCIDFAFIVKRSVRLKNVVSVPSVQDILITYSEVVLTSILEFSDKIREASANECTSYKMKNTQKRPVSEQFQNTIEN